MESRNVKEVMIDVGCIEAMQEELLQFKWLDVWELVPYPDNIKPLTLKWLFKNKLDEKNTVIINKARLVVKGYRQEKGFINVDHPIHVHKLKKALYGLKQALRAWYDKLSKFLLQNHFTKGAIDPTLFTIRYHNDILVLTNPPRGIFINHSNYVLEILKKHGMENCDPIVTPMETKHNLDLDTNETPVDATKYQSMISSLMCLTSSILDIVHATFLCARYRAQPSEKHLKEIMQDVRTPSRVLLEELNS
ncbi:retrovirus-related pol polyprotein from transposon TNT 1-94 [Tanacetum coccineum]